MAPPFRIAEFDMGQNGISKEGDVLDIGVEKGILEKSGSFFKFKGEVLGQGRETTKEYFRQHTDVMNEIEKLIWEKVKPTVAANAKKAEEAQGIDV